MEGMTLLTAPRGIAVAGDRVWYATDDELISTRGDRVDVAGQDVHDVLWCGGRLWWLATARSSLRNDDGAAWWPPTLSGPSERDVCHPSGVAVRDDEPAFVSVLGDGYHDWHAGPGAVFEVGRDEPTLTGLLSPHAPRWHDGALWLLESGRQRLLRVAGGVVREVAHLAVGFLKGLVMLGDTALVGCAGDRDRTPSRVLAVNLRSGAHGELAAVDEPDLFDVQVLAWRR